MRKLLIVVLAFLLPNCSRQTGNEVDLTMINPRTLAYRFELTEKRDRPDYFQFEDVDNDNEIELIQLCDINNDLSSPPPRIIVSDIVRNEDNFEVAFNGSIWNYSLIDLDRDCVLEFFISERKLDEVYFYLLDQKGKILLKELGAVFSTGDKGLWDCSIVLAGAEDYNRDGLDDLVLLANTGRSYQPRFMGIYDVYRKTWIWRLHGGFYPIDCVLFDVDGDGTKDILFSSSAPGNCKGVKINGTDDYHTYLGVYYSKTKRHKLFEWSAGEFEGLNLLTSDVNGDGSDEILFFFQSHGTPKKEVEFGYLSKTDPFVKQKTIRLKEDIANVGFYGNEYGGKNIVICSKNEDVIVVNEHLEKVIDRKFLRFKPQQVRICDINEDYQEEIFISGRLLEDTYLVLLNRDFEILGIHRDDAIQFSERDPICFSHKGETDRIAISNSNSLKFLRVVGKTPLSRLDFSRAVNLEFFLLTFSVLATAICLMSRERKRLQEIFIDSLGTGAMWLDGKGRIRYVNREFGEIMGISIQGKLNSPARKAFGNGRMKQITDMIEESYRQDAPMERDLTLASGTHKELLIRINPFSWSRRVGSGRLVLVQNISGLTISKNTVVWAGMAQRLAHEIKTPLSVVMLSAQRLQMEKRKKSGKNQSDKYIQFILEQVTRLQKMTNAFMKLVHVERPKYESVDVNQLLRDLLKEDRFGLREGIAIKTVLESELQPIQADRQQLAIALQNLIDNSAKAIRSEGVVTVSSRSVQARHKNPSKGIVNQIQIQIDDTGEGIPKERMADLFNPFYSGSRDGSGIGLVIVKRIVEDHGGEILITSQENIGTSAVITLPVSRER